MNSSKLIGPAVTLIGFTAGTALVTRHFSNGTGELLSAACLFLPVVTYVVALYFVGAVELVKFLFGLLLLPLHLLGIGKKRTATNTTESSKFQGWSAIVISTFLYWLVGKFAIDYRGVEFSLLAFSGMGLVWGVFLYREFQSGRILELESEY